MKLDSTEVIVSEDLATATVIHTKTTELFRHRYFMLESDSGGFSRIERVDDKYYLRNYLREGSKNKRLRSDEISKDEYEKLIREVLGNRGE